MFPNFKIIKDRARKRLKIAKKRKIEEISDFEEGSSATDTELELNLNSPHQTDPEDLKVTLAQWKVNNSTVSRKEMDELLFLLRRLDPSLPKTAATLMQTPRNIEAIKSMGTGSFFTYKIQIFSTIFK